MLSQLIILVGLLSISLVFTNGLSCVHCRMDLCIHDYCKQSQQLFNTSSIETANYVEIEDWINILPCPEKLEERNQTQFIQKCSNESQESCGFFNYKITTNNLINIIPGTKNQSTFPIIGDASQTYESSVIVLGCVISNYKCKTGLMEMNDVPNTNVKNISLPTTTLSSYSSSNETKINHIECINNESNCCKCETDMCNNDDKNNGMKDCKINIYHESQNNPNIGSGNIMLMSTFFISICVAVMINLI